MVKGDTSLGGPDKVFPQTRWSLVWNLSEAESAQFREAIDVLCARYWKPVYTYVRIAWAKSNEDAKDLTQSFFAWLIEGDALKKYAPERGGFRTYLKLLLTRFLGHHDRDAHRIKRGGDRKLVAIETIEETHGSLPDPRSSDPSAAFDEAWQKQLLENSVDNVRKKFDSQARQVQFKVFKEMDLHPEGDPHPSYEELASRHGLGVSQVRNYLFVVREAVREELRNELTQTTRSREEFEEEWNALFGG